MFPIVVLKGMVMSYSQRIDVNNDPDDMLEGPIDNKEGEISDDKNNWEDNEQPR